MTQTRPEYAVPLPALPESPKQFWDRPKPKDVGDSDEIHLYVGVGSALTAWEYVEHSFAELFTVLVQSESRAASRAYGSIAGNAGRREALQQAAEIFFVDRQVSDIDKSYFVKLLSHFKEAASRRNDIAHGVVVHLFVKDVTEKDYGIFLCPAGSNSRKTLAYPTGETPLGLFGSDYRYTAADVQHFLGRFHQLKQWSTGYFGRVSKTYGSR